MKSTEVFPDIEASLGDIGCTKIKTASTKKADIQIVIYDAKLGLTPQLGFSIKLMIGSPHSLTPLSPPTSPINWCHV